jgi:hypothetical protein
MDADHHGPMPAPVDEDAAMVSRPKRTKPPKTYEHTCEYCGLDFTSHSHNSRTCSDACRTAKSREKRNRRAAARKSG